MAFIALNHSDGQVLRNPDSDSHLHISESKGELGEMSVGGIGHLGEVSLLLLFVCCDFARHST